MKALYYSSAWCGERLHFAYGDIGRVAALCLARGGYVCTPNALMLERARRDRDFARILARSSLLVPDGVGACTLLRLSGCKASRCAGIDLGTEIVKMAARHSLPLFLYGGHAGVAAEAARRLRARFPTLKIAGTRHGYGNPSEDGAAIRASGARIVFVCLGSPKQELFMAKHLPRSMLAIGLGGALNVYAGMLARAPYALRISGAEWAWRMLLEPRRLKDLPELLSFYMHVPTLLVKETESRRFARFQIGRN